MELWIRSQDKRILVNTRRIDVDDNKIIIWDEGKYASDVFMGEYKTKERALEVLDEIQNILKQEEMLHINKSLLNDLDDIEEPKYILKPVYQPRVYEMPQD